MRTIAYAVASALMAVVLAGCGADEPDVEIVGDWTLASGNTADGDLVAPGGSRITLSFDGEVARGSTSCNDFGGEYDIDGDELSFDGFDQTLQGCEDERGSFERDYLAALDEVDHVARDGDELTLTGDDVSLQFTAMTP